METIYQSDAVTVQSDTDGFIFKVVSHIKGVRSKTFKGETAWSDSLRYVHDELDFMAAW